jgi:hypothetical protein
MSGHAPTHVHYSGIKWTQVMKHVLATTALVAAFVSPVFAHPYDYMSRCHNGDLGACKEWRDRACAVGWTAACLYDQAREQADPGIFCEQHTNNAASYRFCLNGSPDR